MTQDEEEQRRRAERARRAGLFRYGLIQDVIDPQLSAAQRGALVRGSPGATRRPGWRQDAGIGADHQAVGPGMARGGFEALCRPRAGDFADTG